MTAIGLDIGTTTICGQVLDGKTGAVLDVATLPNRAGVRGNHPHENIQDGEIIWDTVRSLLDGMLSLHGEIGCIGISTQMHGIVYLDGEGNPVSPLATWQDGRGGLEFSPGVSYAQQLSRLTGYSPLAAGYGAVTHFYNAFSGQIPGNAATFCTIGDFIGMRLAGCKSPRMHPSNAAGLGLYSCEKGDFDREAIQSAGMDPALFPQTVHGHVLLGRTGEGIPVAGALGDNQASFLGSVRDPARSLLINVGTGGQISLASGQAAVSSPLIEVRPLDRDGACLLVGSTLCAGSAYALLERFFSQVLAMGGAPGGAPLYGAMETLAARCFEDGDSLEVDTRFRGTRQDSDLRGSVHGLGVENFTPQHFILGVLRGMAEEFAQLYGLMELPPERSLGSIVCSGNGVRKNRILQRILGERFGMPLFIPAHKEEACYGAALYAMTAAGLVADLAGALRLIHYEGEAEII